MADVIRLTGIAATGYHGVLEHERRDGQRFVADVVLHLDTRPAAAADDLAATVDYAAVASRVAGVLAGEPADLVETVAERVAAEALTFDAVTAVDVTLHKPEAPITVPFTDVAVEIHRDRVTPPAVPAPSTVVPAGVAVPSERVPADLPGPLPEPVSAGAAAAGAVPAGAVMPTIADLLLPTGGVPALEPEEPEEPAGAAEAPSDAPPPLPPGVPPTAPPPDRMDAVPDAPVEVVLALGSNLGASQDTLREAVHALVQVPGLEVTAVGPLARTAAVGGPDQPDYLNTVVLGRTTLSPRALLRECLAVEEHLGRVRTERWGPRVIDVDLVVHGSTVGVSDDLELPHPRAHERAFVLLPWAQVDPAAVLPGLGGGPVAALAETAPDREGIRWVNLDWWAAEAR